MISYMTEEGGEGLLAATVGAGKGRTGQRTKRRGDTEGVGGIGLRAEEQTAAEGGTRFGKQTKPDGHAVSELERCRIPCFLPRCDLTIYDMHYNYT
jgi:hypothetical protein